jgi:hypothetical protein
VWSAVVGVRTIKLSFKLHEGNSHEQTIIDKIGSNRRLSETTEASECAVGMENESISMFILRRRLALIDIIMSPIE